MPANSWTLRGGRAIALALVVLLAAGTSVGARTIIEPGHPFPPEVIAAPEPQQDPPPDDPPPDEPPAPRATPSDKLRMRKFHTIGGAISPKSIVAAPNGRFFAMNMMYTHTVTVYNRRYKLVRAIQDTVRLSRFGAGTSSAEVRGAPVEGAVSPDGRYIYVSNYSMYGPGFPNPGFDKCLPTSAIDRSYVYRIDTHKLRITGVYRAGEVPKYLAVSPNGRWLLVANWCSMDITVIDLRKGKVVKTIKSGWNPRGIAFSPDSRKAYVAEVGMGDIRIINLRTLRDAGLIEDIGKRPRHLVMSPDGRYLYVTLEGEEVPGKRDGSILKLKVATRKVVDRIGGLDEPRTTVMAPDGRSLYVVDYFPGEVVKIATDGMRKLQAVDVGYHPIGVTYDAEARNVWVAGYTGQIWVLRDRKPGEAPAAQPKRKGAGAGHKDKDRAKGQDRKSHGRKG